MPEYIECKALLNALKEERKNGNFVFTTKWIKEIMDNLPAADVVEVVRCKDCVFSRELDEYEKKLYLDNCVGCCFHSKSYYSLIMEDKDFCSCGERKEGAEE